MIGAGLRIVAPYFLLFEKLINLVHRHAPASTKLCFNSNPTDTAEAVKRWVQPAKMLLTLSTSTRYYAADTGLSDEGCPVAFGNRERADRLLNLNAV